MLRKTEGKRRRGRQRTRWLDGTTDSMDMSLSKLWELVKDRESGVLQSPGLQRVGHDWETEQQRGTVWPWHAVFERLLPFPRFPYQGDLLGFLFCCCCCRSVVQLCPAPRDSMDYTVHGILQARILEWVDFPFSRRSFQPRDWTEVSCIAGGFFTSWATREAHRYRYRVTASVER